MEHSQTSTAPGVPFASFKLTLSEDARASLEAVRAAQETARLRARRQTMQARLWFAVILGAGALVVGTWPRLKHSLGGRASSMAVERTASPSLPPTAPTSPPVENSMTGPAARPAATAEAKNPAATAALAPSDDDQSCDRAAVRTTPWRVSPEACIRAFQANPTDATLALAIAQAEHAHGSHAEAAQWAKRALALDPSAAEAYVIVARAEKEGNRPEEAREAYRRYLELAPRGWHHSEARTALRSERSRGD
jgi:tetratricopeptide (TPR) repeat protein